MTKLRLPAWLDAALKGRTFHRAWLAVIPLAILAMLWPALNGGFVFDDFPNIVLNRAVRVTSLDPMAWLNAALSSNAGELKRPIPMLTFVAQNYLTGMAPAPMKAFNFSVHALNALLVYGLLQSLLKAWPDVSDRRRRWLALAGAALWAAMPINFLPAAFIVQRMETMAHSFVLAGLWLYCDARNRAMGGTASLGRAMLAIVVFTLLAMLCKESGAMLPLYAFCLELTVYRFAGSRLGTDRRLVGFYVAVLALPALIGGSWVLLRALRPGAFYARDFTLVERLLTEPRVLFDYIGWTLLPNISTMGLFHDDYVVSRGLLTPPTTLVAAVGLCLLAATAAAVRRTRPLTALGILLFLAGHLMTATVIPLELVFEHRNYFPSLGAVMVLIDLLALAPASDTRRRIGFAGLLALAAFYGVVTHLRAEEWNHPVRFGITEAARHPLSPRATYQLGQTLALLSEGKPDSPYTAMAFDALEKARQVPSAGILPAQALLIFASRTGRPLKGEWWQEIVDRLESRPIGAQERGALTALSNCAVSSACKFPPSRMLKVFQTAVARQIHPEILNAYANWAFNNLRDGALAESLLRDACRLAPGEPQYRANLATVLIYQRKFRQAEREIAIIKANNRHGQSNASLKSLAEQMRSVRAAAGQPASTP